MMKKLSLILVCAAGVSLADAAPAGFEQVEAAAMKGDYQAQRNLAYGYVALPYPGQQKNPLLGCAWYQLIVHSGSDRIDEGDIGNARVYCNRLKPDEREAATAQARQLFKRVYRKEAKF